MISGHQGLLTSGYQDAKTSIRIDFLISLFHDGLSSRFIHPVSRLFCSRCRLWERAVRLFRLAGEQAETERDIRPVFLGGRNIICFAPGKLCFQLREIDFVTENSLPARGVENSSEVVVSYRGHRGPTRNLAGEGFSNAFREKQRIPWRKNCHFKERKWRLTIPFSEDETAKFRINFTNLDALLSPQFIQLRAFNPTFASSKAVKFVLSRRSILQNFGHSESGFDAVSVPIFLRNGR